MASPSEKVVEGIFAVHKPPKISSYEVIRQLQNAFEGSSLFQPWFTAERARRDRESQNQQRRRRDKSLKLKMGHGGTLDPMATGVLIIGIGRGTKSLGQFLECTKTYRADVLFGAATDTYDILGKVLSKAPHDHVTKEKVEEALGQFRGDIMQTPPIYSALKQDGKKLYEYAREGKEPPREIQQRPVTVEKLEIVEWLGNEHDFRLPIEEATENEKQVAEKVLHLSDVKEDAPQPLTETGEKRKRDDGTEGTTEEPAAKRPQTAPEDSQAAQSTASKVEAEAEQSAAEVSEVPAQSNDSGERAPAVKLDMTTTSGFYVRSLCHDLGKAVGSHGLMASLVRSRQSDYVLGQNVLELDEIKQGEEVWGPKLKGILEEWLEKNPEPAGGSQPSARDRRDRHFRRGRGR